jgi:hypothetical protein
MVLLAGYRGLRWGEVSGLRRERVNLLKSRIEISEILVEVDGKFSSLSSDDVLMTMRKVEGRS